MTQTFKMESENKWSQELGLINKQEYKKYDKVIQCVKEIKLKDFQYKILNKILVTKHFLHKIKIDNNLCEYCQQAPETIFHLFIECEIVKRFWENLKTCLNNNANINISLTNRAILFANQDNNSPKNYIMILAKYYVYANKFHMTGLSIDKFINMLGKKFQAERYIANQNNTVVKFLKKWTPLYNFFTRSDMFS